MSKEEINFEDFMKVKMVVGKVLECEKVEGSNKLLRLVVDIGDEKRQIVTGMSQFFEPDVFIDKLVPVVVNLKKRKIFGLESQGMIMAIDDAEEKPVLFEINKKVKPGSLIH